MTQLDTPLDAPKLGRKRDHTRDAEILEAALDVLAETGYDGMTVDMVATRAKAGKATLYRRWASKSELVIDAVACMKQIDPDFTKLPDTGSLRDDLVGMIKPPSMAEGERKMKVFAGVLSMISTNPELIDSVHAAIVEPRITVNRYLLQRAVDRGEVRADIDIETLALVSQSMVSYRVLMLRKPIDRAFLVSIIDGVIMPAVRR